MSFASTLRENKDMSIPDLPQPAHADLDSMLSRKFGREVANYFSGEFKVRLKGSWSSTIRAEVLRGWIRSSRCIPRHLQRDTSEDQRT